jgi:hypothetical protein
MDLGQPLLINKRDLEASRLHKQKHATHGILTEGEPENSEFVL